MINKAAPCLPERRTAPHSYPELMFPSTEDSPSPGNTVSDMTSFLQLLTLSWKPPISGHSRTIKRVPSMVVSTNRGIHKQGATRSYQKKQEDAHPEEGKRSARDADRSPGTEMPSKAPKGLCQRHIALTNQAAAQGTWTVSTTNNCCGMACHTHDIQSRLRQIYILSYMEDT